MADTLDEFGSIPIESDEDEFGSIPLESGTAPEIPADDNARPSTLASFIRGAGRGTGVAGVGQAITAGLRSAVGDTTYDYEKAREEARAKGAREEHPFAEGAGAFLGASAQMLRAGPTAAAQGLLGAFKGAMGSESDSAGGRAADALMGGATGAAFGGAMKAAPVETALAGSAMSGVDALQSAASGDYAGAVEQGLNTATGIAGGVAPHFMAARDRQAAKIPGELAKATEDVGAQANAQAHEMGREAASAAEQAKGIEASQATAADTNLDLALAQRRKSESEAAKRGILLARQAHRAELEPYRQAVAEQQKAIEAHRLQKQEENRLHRLNGALRNKDFLERMEGFRAADKAWSEHAEAAKGTNREMKDAAIAGMKKRELAKSMAADWQKEGAALRKELAAAEQKRESIKGTVEGEYGEIHRELFTRFANYIDGARLIKQAPDPAVVARFRHLMAKREALNPQKSAKLDRIMEVGGDKWKAERQAELGADANEAVDAAKAALERYESKTEPDWNKAAEKEMAAREAEKYDIPPEVRASIDKTLAANGVLPENVTNEMILSGEVLSPGERPEAPDRHADQVANNEFMLKKASEPTWQPPPKPERPQSAAPDLSIAEQFRKMDRPVDTDKSRLASELGAGSVKTFDLPEGPQSPEAKRANVERIIDDLLGKGRRNLDKDYASRQSVEPSLAKTPGEQYFRETQDPGPVKTAASILRRVPIVKAVVPDPKAPVRVLTPFERSKDAMGESRFSDPAKTRAVLMAALEESKKRRKGTPSSWLKQGEAEKIQKVGGAAATAGARQGGTDFEEWVRKRLLGGAK